jgi:hypothetical protein
MKIHNLITGTNPLHIHANGGLKSLGSDCYARAQNIMQAIAPRTRKCHRASQLEVAVYSNFTEPTLAETSLAEHGYVPASLGNPGGLWKNRYKPRLSLEHIQRSSARWLMFSDATDAIFLAHPDVLLERFLAMDCDVLISGERRPWPSDCPAGEPDAGRYRYGNSGAVIGWRDSLAELYAAAQVYSPSKVHPASDQHGLRQAAMKLGVRIDVNAELFQTLAFIDEGEIQVQA